MSASFHHQKELVNTPSCWYFPDSRCMSCNNMWIYSKLLKTTRRVVGRPASVLCHCHCASSAALCWYPSTMSYTNLYNLTLMTLSRWACACQTLESTPPLSLELKRGHSAFAAILNHQPIQKLQDKWKPVCDVCPPISYDLLFPRPCGRSPIAFLSKLLRAKFNASLLYANSLT